MSFVPATAKTAHDILHFSRRQSLLYNGLVAFFETTGLWKYPIRASGDFEDMTFRDLLYWVYKTKNHVTRASRGSNLESFFERQRTHQWALPDTFAIERQASLSAVGDLMNHEFLARSSELYSDVADIVFGADLPMANLECVALESPSGRLEFDGRTSPRLFFSTADVDAVKGHKGHNYAFMATACNHSLDFGSDGVHSTIETLRARGIHFHGLNERKEDAEKATLIERNGILIGVISHTFGLNALKPPSDQPWMVNRTKLNLSPGLIDFALIDRQLAHCKHASVDFVVAQLHWGMEFEHYPTPAQLEVAHTLAEKGIDAIFGHHSHVVQPVEYYRTRRDPERIVPIYYSLGNLTNPFWDPRVCRSLVARLELAKGSLPGGGSRTYVKHAGGRAVEQVMDSAKRELRLRPCPAADRD